MGYYFQFDLEPQQPAGSVHGWGDFRRWAETLPAKSYGALRHFCAYGWTGDVKDLAEQLPAALQAKPPKVTGVRETAVGFAALAEKFKRAEVVTLTDGMGSDDGEE